MVLIIIYFYTDTDYSLIYVKYLYKELTRNESCSDVTLSGISHWEAKYTRFWIE